MRNTLPTLEARGLTRRAEVRWAAGAVLLVALAVTVPRIMGEPWRSRLYAGAAPLFGTWLPHIGWGTGPALGIAVAVVACGPIAARRLPWRQLLGATWLTAAAWAFALAMVDGWQRGFAGRLTTRDEYLHEVGVVHDIGAMVRGFSGRILDFQPDSWTTHVSGHPPGALLAFVLLDRLGLGGGAWAGLLCLLGGSSAAAAVLVTLRALGAVETARAAAPFLALTPAAIWLAVSADALFTGVTAWAVAALAVATRQWEGWVLAAVAAGIAFGFGLFLSYGMVLMAVPALAVLTARSFRPLLPAVLGALAVVALFAFAGFWWLDGYHLVVQRYYQGIASERPYSYWVWANLAATVCAVGLAGAAALPRVLRGLHLTALWSPPRPRDTADAYRDAYSADTPSHTITAEDTSPEPHARTARAAPDEPKTPNAVAADAVSYDRRAVVTATSTHEASTESQPSATKNPSASGGQRMVEAGRDGLARWRAVVDPAALLAAAGVGAILLADASGLSKAETERIWLPFGVWVAAGTGLLTRGDARVWLGVQAAGALLINHFVLTNW
ncbi:hypothetical protein H0264_17975 [Nocardia huaxiensis]|uniref:Integral membrane protein n=1 Tax=Nocardia huaxiensis TaxID=2755382 RepID=A0A7D6VF25_9NOCA|nr:hypothetical protein [Nocardia huaxiensis]QLY33871.1 hypothetical protein H0264_17975 [Nocardia huaxiensis]UFS99198.1 hypothetical protein LPY97_15540 [Nocardia huaxiensis]